MRIQLQQTYHVVAALSAQSGFHWDDEHDADINEDSEAVWQAYVHICFYLLMPCREKADTM